MAERMTAREALNKVGVERDQRDHWARADPADQTVYLLHSLDCLMEWEDLTQCPHSLAMDRGIDPWQWPEEAVVVSVWDGRLEPTHIWDMPRAAQWDRHRKHNGHGNAALRDTGIHCGDCPWHTYEKRV